MPSKFSSIKSVGIELEGGVCLTCSSSIISNYRAMLHVELAGDWSVQVPIHCGYNRHPCIHDAEIRAWTDIENLSHLFEFVDRLFYEGHFTQNETCGNHVHVRFNNPISVENFRSKTSWNSFKKKYKYRFRSGKHIERLKGKYASSDWRLRDRNKRTMINFESLYVHSTLEFRPLSWFESSNEAIDSYTKLLKIIDTMGKVK